MTDSLVASPPPALAQPGPALTEPEVQRYHRHLLMPEFGESGQRRLRNARVLVMGAGGLGSPILTYLAAAGCGELAVVDDDVVDISNLQRQVLFGPADLGRPKVEAARERLAEINPAVRVVPHHVRVDASNVEEIFRGYDLVIDGTDNFATRYLVNDACVLLGIPYVWGSVLRFEGQVSVFWEAHGPQYRDLYPEPPPEGLVPSCAEGGVLGVLCAMIGSAMANEAVKLLTGIGEPLLGRLMVLDALSATWRTFPVRRRPDTYRPTSVDDLAVPVVCGLPQAAATASLDVSALSRVLAEGLPEGCLLVDVREPFEHAQGALPGSVLIPQGDLLEPENLALLGSARSLIVYCASGPRSISAAEKLTARGIRDVTVLRGGMRAWSAAGEGPSR